MMCFLFQQNFISISRCSKRPARLRHDSNVRRIRNGRWRAEQRFDSTLRGRRLERRRGGTSDGNDLEKLRNSFEIFLHKDDFRLDAIQRKSTAFLLFKYLFNLNCKSGQLKNTWWNVNYGKRQGMVTKCPLLYRGDETSGDEMSRNPFLFLFPM